MRVLVFCSFSTLANLRSSFLRVLVMKAPIEKGSNMMSSVEFEQLCRLTFTELAELRHRGAFSAVAQAFASCCARAQALGREDLLRNMFKVDGI